MSDDIEYYVEVISIDDKEVVRRLGPMRETKADIVERGILIDMDRERFFTRVISKIRNEQDIT